MSVELRVVSDSEGRIGNSSIGGDSVELRGTIQPEIINGIENPYIFYVQDTGSAGAAVKVNLTLPVGGNISGLYRFPRVGEKVLVEIGKETENYLLAYLPGDTNNPFTPVEAETKTTERDRLLAEQGMILRYQQTGKKEDQLDEGEEYSEIGFYNKPAAWRPLDKDSYNTFDEKDYPKIDHINIQSTGDIKSSAVNHHLIMGKRLEILANCPEIDHTTNKDADGEAPLGDNPGDDSALHGGDVHIRAGRRVVIKADDEIRLQVGRTVLVINDNGLNIITKTFDSNMTNVYDTVFAMAPLKGISMYGKGVNISAGRKVSIGDSLGGEFSSSLGVVGVSGKDISLECYNGVEYGFLELSSAVKMAQAIAAGTMAATGTESEEVKAYVEFASDSIEKLANWIRGFKETLGEREESIKKAQEQAANDMNKAAMDANREMLQRENAMKMHNALHEERLKNEGTKI
jgi:hypothetical protein